MAPRPRISIYSTLRRLRVGAFKAAILLLLLVLPNAQAFGWGCAGHQTVALVALSQLNASASAKVHELLQGQPLPAIHRFCGATSLDVFADVATWADDERDVRKQTGNWHFLDIPLGASRGDLATFCDPVTGCVTRVLNTQLDVLRSGKGSRQDQANALMFVVHFFGDLHQPLHDTTNNDRGANCIPVTFFGQKPKLTDVAGEGYTPNLHGVWDTEFPMRIGKIGDKSRDDDVKRFAAQLTSEFSAEIKTWQRAPVDLDQWAWDSHELAVTIAYGELPTFVPVEKPQSIQTCADDNNVGNRMKALNEDLEEPYLGSVTPVIKQQLAKAGTRLAMVLNQLWP
jgi:hypothetical protein